MAHPGRPRKCDPKVGDLSYNIRQGDYKTAKATLAEFGIDAEDGEGRTALINAVIDEREDFMDWLLQNGANINHQDRIGYSALHFIAQESWVTLAEKFLKSGANPNLPDIHGNTPLWTAIFESVDEPGVVRLLLKYGADSTIVNKYGKSPNDLYISIYGKDISSFI